MADFDKNKIRRLDGTLLLVFQGLMRTGKAVDVAAQLGLTNSSISHALGRLRDIFEDDLFLRRPHGLEPTAYAKEVAADVEHALNAMQAALSDTHAFDPGTADLHLRLSARDSEIAAILPQILSGIRSSAPNVRVSVRSMGATDAVRALRGADIDLALGFFRRNAPDIDQRLLRQEAYLVVARAGHPIMRRPMTLADYRQADHVLVSSDGSLRGIVDETLAQQGHSRRVVLALPHFMPTLAMVAQSDTIATLPATLVRRYAETFDLAFQPPPLDIRSFDIRVLSHARDRRNPAIQWCAEQILNAGPTAVP